MIGAQVREAEEMGILDPRLLDDYQSALVELIEAEVERGLAGCRDVVGEAIAETDRPPLGGPV